MALDNARGVVASSLLHEGVSYTTYTDIFVHLWVVPRHHLELWITFRCIFSRMQGRVIFMSTRSDAQLVVMR